MVPITADYFSSHLAAELGLPVMVVALNRLGCLNHIFLTVRALEAAGLRCAGVVLNDFAAEPDVAMKTNAEILRAACPCRSWPGSAPDSGALGGNGAGSRVSGVTR